MSSQKPRGLGGSNFLMCFRCGAAREHRPEAGRVPGRDGGGRTRGNPGLRGGP